MELLIEPTPAVVPGSRRLYPRFPTNLDARLYAELGQSIYLPAKVTDIARDNLTCVVLEMLDIKKGAFIRIQIGDGKFQVSIDGQVLQVIQGIQQTRLGIRCSKSESQDLNKLISENTVLDRRSGERRTNNSLAEDQREFDRRRFWKGLSTKRYFSNYIWGLQRAGVYFFMKPLQSGTSAHVVVDGREMVMMSSNNYLGLTTHPKIKEAAIRAIEKYGSAPGASSLLGGTLDIHLELEAALAKFKGAEAVSLFSSGYVTNVTTLITVLGKEDTVFNDELNHASLIDGSRLSKADVRAYRHTNVADLEKKLSRCKTEHRLVATDTVFSMDGDLAPLPDIFRLCKKYNAAFMVDEAHGTGVFGAHGKGLLEHFGMEGKPDIVMGTLSKSLAGTGGFIAGSKELIRILKHTARAFVFSAYLPASICAAVLAALEIIEKEPERRQRLWQNTQHMRNELQTLGFNTGNSQSPIIPVVFPTERETHLMTKGLRELGIFVSPVVYPAVKKNATRVRLSMMATHTDNDIEMALSAFKKVYASIS